MKYKKRISESKNPQKLAEYLQGGLILRFNEEKIIKNEGQENETETYQCTEFWFSLDTSLKEIEEACKEFQLTDEYKKIIR